MLIRFSLFLYCSGGVEMEKPLDAQVREKVEKYMRMLNNDSKVRTLIYAYY